MLNQEQLRVFRKIQEYLTNGKQLLLFVSGEGGTGKSLLLRHCVENIRRYYDSSESVEVVSPTGTAAYNVLGTTIHSAFRIPVQGSIRDDVVDELREKYANLKWLFVDEISMVSKQLWEKVNGILQRIKNSQTDFGALNIVLFGDLLQLSPVKAEWIFEHPCWSHFNFVELKTNERQQHDEVYHELCSRLRVGNQSECDIPLLQTRMLAFLSTEEQKEFENALHVFTLRNAAAEINRARTEELKDKQTFYAIDEIKKERSDCVPKAVPISDTDRAMLRKEDVFDVAFEIVLGTDSRVMLRTNIDVSSGLVNGRTGTVTRVEPDAVYVRFDHSVDSVKILPTLIKKHLKRGLVHERFQLPLMLCWGVTAHKVQGLTLSKMVVRINRDDLFCDGLASVILGRVCSLKDIAFSELYPDSFLKSKPDSYSLAEYRRLRSLNEFV